MPWQLNGNNGTNGSANFLGTTDNQPLVIKTNGIERSRITRDGIFAIRQNAIVGAGSNGSLKVRHIDGKDFQSDADDALYLNWATGRPVVLGQNSVRCDLHVNGNVHVLGDIALANADCAEEFIVKDMADAEPGTLMVFDQDGDLCPSTHAYDKKVAGVISGAKEYKPALVLDKTSECANRIPIALLGKVYCKVDAIYSSVAVGDLLTTSSTRGHAMKATNPKMLLGAVIGKAMAGLENGRGLIPILVALQ